MSEKSSESRGPRENAYKPPAWLTEVLRRSAEGGWSETARSGVVAAGEEFHSRCVAAGERALALARLRKERQRVGFVPLPIGEYVQGIAKVIGVPLEPLYAWFGITEGNGIDPASAEGWAPFAHKIGMTAQECLTHLRIGFAHAVGAAVVPVLVARARAGDSGTERITACERVLNDIEKSYDRKTKSTLETIEANAQAVFDTLDEG